MALAFKVLPYMVQTTYLFVPPKALTVSPDWTGAAPLFLMSPPDVLLPNPKSLRSSSSFLSFSQPSSKHTGIAYTVSTEWPQPLGAGAAKEPAHPMRNKQVTQMLSSKELRTEGPLIPQICSEYNLSNSII